METLITFCQLIVIIAAVMGLGLFAAWGVSVLREWIFPTRIERLARMQNKFYETRKIK